jgi:transglutaminase-like putative cysteine protease
MESNLPSFDATNKVTLGFPEQPGQYLSTDITGIASVGANLSVSTRSVYPWAMAVSRDLFLEYVVPYASVNEGRNNWRPLLLEAVRTLLGDAESTARLTTADVAAIINNGLWSGVLGKPIEFKSSQTPVIYDPMSSITFGFASCTGISLLYIDALRSAGIAARLAGTPAWNRDASHGNHNWVELWLPERGEWAFVEGGPAGGADETLFDPCDKWFCEPGHFANGTMVFAARFDQSSSTRYPMAWDPHNTEIPGEDRSAYYQATCSKCPGAAIAPRGGYDI